MKPPKIITLSFFVFALALSGCCADESPAAILPGSTPANELVADSECIVPQYEFAYPVGENEAFDLPEAGPGYPWEMEIHLPQLEEGVHEYSYFIGSNKEDDHIEIWVRRNLHYDDSSPRSSDFEILIYRDDEKTWRKLSEGEGEEMPSLAKVYRQENGALWAFEQISSREMRLLVYDYEENAFHPLPEIVLIPNGRILFNGKETFWIIKPADAIYSFSLGNFVVERHAEIEDITHFSLEENMAMDRNGDIYILQIKKEYIDNSDLELIRFSTATGEIERDVRISLGLWPWVSSIFVDHENRLWLSDAGWMADNGQWFQTIRSPIFLDYREIDSPDYQYTNYPWLSPTVLFETSERYLWFRSRNGIARLDLENEEWCWVTSAEYSDLIKDPDKGLWILKNGQLFVQAEDMRDLQ